MYNSVYRTFFGIRTPVSRIRAFRSELEREFSKCEVTLLYDLGACDRVTRLSPRVDLIPISMRKLHTKITLLLWTKLSTTNGTLPEKQVRLIVGSANLMRQGFRENYEVVTSLDYGQRSRLRLQERALCTSRWR